MRSAITLRLFHARTVRQRTAMPVAYVPPRTVSQSVEKFPSASCALAVARNELPNIDAMISSQYSPLLADGLARGKIDAAFLRRGKGVPGLAFRVLAKEAFDGYLA
jgi:hypothetical protein